ncbi:MAG: putative glutamate--cysteine ligase, partial [Cyanobacteria bacterium J06573_11]
KDSLDAQLRHWSTGKPIIARDWIQQLYAEIHPVAKRSGILCFLNPIQQILRNGNQAQRWLKQSETSSPTAVIQQAIANMAHQEQSLTQDICQPEPATVA